MNEAGVAMDTAGPVVKGFVYGLWNVFNFPTFMFVIFASLACGYVIGLSHREAHTRIPPRLVGLLACGLLASFQVAVFLGQSIHTPDNFLTISGARAGAVLLTIFGGLFCWFGAFVSDVYPGTKKTKVVDPDFRDTDDETLPSKLGHLIERSKVLVQPLTDLIKDLYTRLYWVLALVIICSLSVSILTLIVWLSSMQRIWNLDPGVYVVISSMGLVVNVLGWPLVIVLYLRRAA